MWKLCAPADRIGLDKVIRLSVCLIYNDVASRALGPCSGKRNAARVLVVEVCPRIETAFRPDKMDTTNLTSPSALPRLVRPNLMYAREGRCLLFASFCPTLRNCHA